MLTGELKNKIDQIWEMFWTGGITNPLDVVEQMTYLMFIHDLDDADAKKAKSSLMLEIPHTSMFEGHEQYKWSVFRDLPAEKMYELMQTEIFPFIKNLHGNKESSYSKYMGDAIFKIPTPQLLSKIVDALDGLYQDMAKQMEADTKGDVYEHLLAKLSTAGVNGQFRTPRHIIRMMVELLDPKPDDTICDPACGTSGFLVAAGEYLKETYHDEIFYSKEKKAHYNNAMFFGYDMDRTMLRVGAMNMMTHGVENPNIDYRDSLSDQNTDTGRYSIILANPPFKGSLDADVREGVHTSKLMNLHTKGILYLIESYIRLAKSALALLGFQQYSLEHLMPKKWRNNWYGCANEEQARQRDSILLTLGNLAIIPQSLNASIRDSSWQEKKAGKGNKPGLSACAAGLATFTDVLSTEEWNEETIASRAEWLCEKALELWKI